MGKNRFLRHFFSRLQLAVDQQREQAVQECVNAGVPVEVSFTILFWFSKLATSRNLLSTWSWTCDQLKTINLSANNFTKNKPRWVGTRARDMVMWYWSADTLFWQLSTDHNMDM